MYRHSRICVTGLYSCLSLVITAIFMLAGMADAHAQRTRTRTYTGIVADSISGEPLSHINIYAPGLKKGAVTDKNGLFRISVPKGTSLRATSLGYEDKSIVIGDNVADTLRFMLSPASYDLTEFVVKPKKQKYSKKNNPAVDLMRQLRATKDLHNPTKESLYSYDRYEKMLLGLNDYKGHFNTQSPIDGKRSKTAFIAQLVDTAEWTGKRILDFSLKEKLSTRIFTDGKVKEIIRARKSNGIDKSFDSDYTRVVLEDALREVNVYDNDIPLMRTRFVSPLSPVSADYYKFEITDTVPVGAEQCVELSFVPHNAESQGFNGKLYVPVTTDTMRYVKRAVLRMPKSTNLNYIKTIMISQNFRLDSLGKAHKTVDDMVAELQILPGTPEFYASRKTRYSNFSYDKRKDYDDYYDRVGSEFTINEADGYDNGFWNAERMVSLSHAETQLSLSDSPFRQNRFIYWTEKIIMLVVKGYVNTSKKSKFDIGPIDTFVSYNGAEGWRLLLGGMTTANFSDRFFARGYVAYGLRDKRWKYRGELEYSFEKKKYHSREFPMNGIRLSYTCDVDKLGQHYMTNHASNLLRSIKRRESDLVTYRRLAQIEYNKEWLNSLSVHFSLRNDIQEASRRVKFIDGNGTGYNSYMLTPMRAEIRFAPGEKFIQTNSLRKSVNRDPWVLLLTQDFAPKGFLGSDFTYLATELCVQKRFWLSMFGHTDILIRAGKIWSQVQFPLLFWQNANLAYTMQPETFSCLNPMEFAMDQYASWDLTWHLNGLILNRIPFVKKARLREIFTFKGFAGHLSRKNNPEYNGNLFRFPEEARTQPMGSMPYMEIGVGIDNIFTLLRIDYVWRLSYLGRPGIDRSGLRFSLNFNF